MKDLADHNRHEIEKNLYDLSIKSKLPLIFHFTEMGMINPPEKEENEWREGKKFIQAPFYQTAKHVPEIFYKPISKIWKP